MVKTERNEAKRGLTRHGGSRSKDGGDKSIEAGEGDTSSD